MKLRVLLIALVMVLTYCKKDKKTEEPVTPPAVTVGNAKVSFKGVVDATDLVYNTSKYKTQYGDTFTVSMFKYYITNVVLVKEDGSKFYETNSYHLMDHSSASTTEFTITKIPFGTYKSIQYLIGVDSIHNVSGAQDGDLAQSKGMYWPWLGYINFKFEGSSNQAGSIDKTLVFHIGGYSGANNTNQQRSLTFGQDLVIADGKTPQLKLKTNVNQLFQDPATLDFQNTYDITSPGMRSVGFAGNYGDMISYDVIVP
jgi:hypothetical protein